MRNVAVGVAAFVFSFTAVVPVAAQAPAAATAGYKGPRTSDGKPDLNGIWQALGTAHWNLEAHSAEEGIPPGWVSWRAVRFPTGRKRWLSGSRTSRNG